MLKVPPAQQFYWGNRAVPSLARVAERGGHHGAPPADEASSASTRALIDRIGDPPHAAIEIAQRGGEHSSLSLDPSVDPPRTLIE
jgi:hypothetical protein